MKIKLGYACLTTTINETSSRTITYTNYKKIGTKDGNIKLNEIILSNFNSLKNILKYNIKNDILFYRMTANLIPLATLKDIKFEIFNRYKQEFLNIGNIIKDNNLRVDIHVDQYCVLNSINDKVVESSINILNFNKSMFDAMKIDSKLILHVGGKGNSKNEGIERFINNFNKLDKSLKNIIVLENDDKIYNIKDVLNICTKLNIPMVLDYHHFMCNKESEKIEDYIEKIFNTWGSETPKIHFSSPKNNKEFRSHNDYIDSKSFIDFLNTIKFINRDFDIMIEAKMKDDALFKLIRELKYNDYNIEGTTIYL